MFYYDCEKFSKENFENFHYLVAKILFATKRAIPKTGIAISYITTRVIEPNQSYWSKMVHLFKYARRKKYQPLILSVEKSGMLKC